MGKKKERNGGGGTDGYKAEKKSPPGKSADNEAARKKWMIPALLPPLPLIPEDASPRAADGHSQATSGPGRKGVLIYGKEYPLTARLPVQRAGGEKSPGTSGVSSLHLLQPPEVVAVHHFHQARHHTGRQGAAGHHGKLTDGHILQHGIDNFGKFLHALAVSAAELLCQVLLDYLVEHAAHKNAIHALYSCNLLNMLQAEGCLALR